MNQLHAVKTPDWEQNLSYWDTEIAKARVAISQPEPDEALQSTMAAIEGPIWLKPSSPACELFPAKSSIGGSVAFVGFSGEYASNSKKVERQLTDTLGRFTRSLPLFLAEQTEFGTDARVQTLIPWMVKGEFIVSGAPWEDEEVAGYARQTGITNDFVVSGHIKSQSDPWSLELRLVRTIDAKCVASITSAIDPARPQSAFPRVVESLFDALSEQEGIQRIKSPPLYVVPSGEQFPIYLLRLEQLLAVRCADMIRPPGQFLSGEREILDGNIYLCLANPLNITVRILLTQTLLAMKRVRPDILREFKEKLALLRKEHSMPEMPDKILQALTEEALAS